MPDMHCSKESTAAVLRVESLAFSQIPGQSRLFLDYLSDPTALKRFYPSAVASIDDLRARIPEVLGSYATDREELCDALAAQNEKFGASEETRRNIELLREGDTVAILTGQQTGLFTGPLYAIYKALSAIKLASRLCEGGQKAVPVFWAATEDHDFEEVAGASVLDTSGRLATVRYEPTEAAGGKPVGAIRLDDSIANAIESLFAELPENELTNSLRDLLASAYTPGLGFSDAFARSISGILGRFGLIIVDPLDSRIKRQAAPLYLEAIQKSPEIVDAVRERSKRLASEGYHAQVLVENDYFPLFRQDDGGIRRALKRRSDGGVGVSGEKRSVKLEELSDSASEHPEAFSPGVMLRPVVQDYLFPTLCYFGGSAEIAYFAQNAPVYEILGRPVTPIFHRQSFTIVEPRQSRILKKFGLQFADLFAGFDALLPQIVERYLDPENALLFPRVEERINTELNRLDQQLSQIDPTVAANLATRRRKIVYHLAALNDKYRRAVVRKNDEAERQLKSTFASLLPDGQLQERVLNVTSFLDRYGERFIDQLFDAADLNDRGHRVVYL